MRTDLRRTGLAALAAAALVLTVSLSGCSSDSAAEPAAAADATMGETTDDQGYSGKVSAPAEPVRVGVPEFADIITDPGVMIVDVRTPQEFADGHIDGAVNIPVELPDFVDRVSELDPNGTYAVYCRSGNRSQVAVAGMTDVGINGIYELESGTNGWASEGQPLVQ
jgi:rhodanese-related sulfurtransferase